LKFFQLIIKTFIIIALSATILYYTWIFIFWLIGAYAQLSILKSLLMLTLFLDMLDHCLIKKSCIIYFVMICFITKNKIRLIILYILNKMNDQI
jgi:hypothetical protein